MTAVDFLAGPILDFGVVVVKNPVTIQLDNLTGDKIETFGSNENLTVVFENTNQKYDLFKSGLQEGADARMFVKSTDTLVKYDKVTYQGNVYKVETVWPQYSLAGVVAFYIVLMYLFDS